MPQDTTEVTIEELPADPVTGEIELPSDANSGDSQRNDHDDGAEPAEEAVIPPGEGEEYAPRIPGPLKPPLNGEKKGRPPVGRARTQVYRNVLPAPDNFTLKPGAFFEYLEKIPQKLLKHARLYVFRTWPVLDKDKVKEAGLHLYDVGGARLDGDSEEFQHLRLEDMLHRFGCGSYRMDLHDAKGRKTICRAKIENLGDRDLDIYQPVVDIEYVATDDPVNNTFWRWAKKPGGTLSHEGDGMDNAAVTALAETVQTLTGRAQEKDPMAEALLEAEKSSISIVAEASKAATNMQAEAYSQAIKNTQTSSDPTQMLTTVMGMVKEMVPKQAAAPDPTASLAPVLVIMAKSQEATARMQQQIHEVQQQRMADSIKTTEMLMKQQQQHHEAMMKLAQTKAEKEEKKEEASAKQPSLMSQVKEVFELADMLKENAGGDGAGEGESGTTEKVLNALPYISQLGALATNSIYNLAVAKTGGASGNPEPPPRPSEQLPEAEAAGGSPVTGSPAGAGQPEPILGPLQPPLLKFFYDPTRTGADFADMFMDWHDQTLYGQMAALGVEGISRMIQNHYPQMYAELSSDSEKLQRFLGEFINWQRIRDEEAGVEEVAGDPDGYAEDIPTVDISAGGEDHEKEEAPGDQQEEQATEDPEPGTEGGGEEKGMEETATALAS